MTKKAKVIVAKETQPAKKKAKVLIATSAAKKTPKPASNAQHGTLMGVYADLEQLHSDMEDSLDNVSDLMDEVEALKEGTFTSEGAKNFIAKLKEAQKLVKPLLTASRQLEKALVKARDIGTKSEIKAPDADGKELAGFPGSPEVKNTVYGNINVLTEDGKTEIDMDGETIEEVGKKLKPYLKAIGNASYEKTWEYGGDIGDEGNFAVRYKGKDMIFGGASGLKKLLDFLKKNKAL